MIKIQDIPTFFRSISAWFIGILFLVLFFPLTLICWIFSLPFDSDRRLTHRLLVWQSTLLMKIIPLWKIHIEENAKVCRDSVYVMISNHQSLLDILLINSLGYRFKWVSKIENTKVPVIGWYLRMADYLIIDRNNDESKADLLARSYSWLKNGTSVMLFPEGTRSPSRSTCYFKRGAFQLALEAGVAILPIVLDGTGEVLPKRGILFRGKHDLRLKVLDPVHPSSFGTDDPEKLAFIFREIIDAELGNTEKATTS